MRFILRQASERLRQLGGLATMFACSVLLCQNCSSVVFSTMPQGAQAALSSSPACSATAFGTLCNGSQPSGGGAHAFFYNLTPFPNSSGYAASSGEYANEPLAGSMSLLTASDVIPGLALTTSVIDVPDQDWTVGFPGFSSLQEWFGLCYDASWTAAAAGTYTFVTAADDSIAIWIDGQLVGENDYGTVSSVALSQYPGHGAGPGPVAFAPIALAAGTHSVEIMYYQGWPVSLEAQVWVYPPGAAYQAGSTPPATNLMQLGSPINGALSCPH
jgi:hypothetical protein